MVLPSPKQFLKYSQLDLSRAISSNLIDAKTLFIIRAIISAHLVAVFIATVYVSGRDHVWYMLPTTFTNLSNIGLTAYYLTATYHSYKFVSSKNIDSLAKQHWLLTIFLWFLYGSVVVYHIVVPIIYWAMLFDPNNTMDTLNKYVDFSHHGADLACMLIEVLLNRMNLFLVHLIGTWVGIILYMFLAWIYYAARGEWLYGFLDWSSSLAAAWYIGLLVAFGLLFIGQMYLHRARDHVFANRRKVVAMRDGTTSELLGTSPSGPSPVTDNSEQGPGPKEEYDLDQKL